MPPSSTGTYTLSLHDALPISHLHVRGEEERRIGRDESTGGPLGLPRRRRRRDRALPVRRARGHRAPAARSEEHTSELQSRGHLVCRLLLEKKHIYYLAQRDSE